MEERWLNRVLVIVLMLLTWAVVRPTMDQRSLQAVGKAYNDQQSVLQEFNGRLRMLEIGVRELKVKEKE